MARFRLVCVLLCCHLTLPTLGGGEDENPFMDIASAFLQNMGEGGGMGGNGNGLAALGGLVGSLMQGDNAKNLGALFGQSSNNNVAGDVLSGLGSLLSNQDGKIDPAIMGSMISMFAQQVGNSLDTEPPNQDQKTRQKRQNPEENEINFNGILSAASSLLEGKNTAAILPVIMSTLSSFSGPQAEKTAHDHQDHASFLPPFVEKLHLYWDLFLNSELGRVLWQKSGLQKAVKAFTGADGKVSFELMFKNFENHSFRRHWIKTAAKYLTDSVVHLANPEVYQRYLTTAQYLINGFLESQGFPRHTHFSVTKPEESMTALSNHVLRKYLDSDTDISVYIKPAISYIKQILKMAQSTGQNLVSRADYHALADRLTDTLNLEVIEPVLRVYRAYRHSRQAPHCQEHLMCLVNRHHDTDQHGLPGFKTGLTKLSSFIASAALSFQDGKGFWDLYNAIQNDVNCQAKYPADCAAFHEDEMKVTTEIYHSEL